MATPAEVAQLHFPKPYEFAMRAEKILAAASNPNNNEYDLRNNITYDYLTDLFHASNQITKGILTVNTSVPEIIFNSEDIETTALCLITHLRRNVDAVQAGIIPWDAISTISRRLQVRLENKDNGPLIHNIGNYLRLSWKSYESRYGVSLEIIKPSKVAKIISEYEKIAPIYISTDALNPDDNRRLVVPKTIKIGVEGLAIGVVTQKPHELFDLEVSNQYQARTPKFRDLPPERQVFSKSDSRGYFERSLFVFNGQPILKYQPNLYITLRTKDSEPLVVKYDYNYKVGQYEYMQENPTPIQQFE